MESVDKTKLNLNVNPIYQPPAESEKQSYNLLESDISWLSVRYSLSVIFAALKTAYVQ